MPLYRCHNANCGTADFEAPAANCPGCGCGPGLVSEIVAVHYLVPAEGPIVTGLGNRMIACNPNFAKLPKAATGERSAVTCPRCRASVIFQEDERDGADNHVPYIEQKIQREHNLKFVGQG